MPGSVELVNSAGKIVAKASSKPRYEGNVFAPWISVTASRVYYLDGPSNIRWLKPDGSTGLATTIAVTARQQVSFAVSSDDKRLAVSVLSYGPPPSCGSPCLLPPPFLGTKISVGELAGGSRTTIFTSATLAEVPVGWHQGNVIIGVALQICCQSEGPNPFSISEYHVVNASNGNRVWTVCPAPGHSMGHPQPAGTLCGTGNSNSPLSLQSWTGQSKKAASSPAAFEGIAFLSPDGTRLAARGNGIVLVYTVGGKLLQTLELGPIRGWLDSDHLATWLGGSNTEKQVIVDLRRSPDGLNGALTALPSLNFVVGVFPGGLD